MNAECGWGPVTVEESPGESRTVRTPRSSLVLQVVVRSLRCVWTRGPAARWTGTLTTQIRVLKERRNQKFICNHLWKTGSSQFLSVRIFWRRRSVTRPALLRLSSSSSSNLLSRKQRNVSADDDEAGGSAAVEWNQWELWVWSCDSADFSLWPTYSFSINTF